LDFSIKYNAGTMKDVFTNEGYWILLLSVMQGFHYY